MPTGGPRVPHCFVHGKEKAAEYKKEWEDKGFVVSIQPWMPNHFKEKYMIVVTCSCCGEPKMFMDAIPSFSMRHLPDIKRQGRW